MVQAIEQLRPELEARLLGEMDLFEQREVKTIQPGRAHSRCGGTSPEMV